MDSIQEFYKDIDYKEVETTRNSDTGGEKKHILNERTIRGIVRTLGGNELIIADKRTPGTTARLYSHDIELNFGGIVNGAYKIVYINDLMGLSPFYQYDLERVI